MKSLFIYIIKNSYILLFYQNNMSESNLKRKVSETTFRVRQSNDHLLRNKIKVLEDQVGTLQTGMNMFADIKSNANHNPSSKSLPKCDHVKLLQQLKSKIVRLQNKNKAILQQKRIIQTNLLEVSKKLDQIQIEMQNLKELNSQLQEACQQKDKSIFTLELQNKYLKQENAEFTQVLKQTKFQLQGLKSKLFSIQNNKLVQIALKHPLILLKYEDYKQLRQEIFRLKKKINQMEIQRQWSKNQHEFSKKRQIVMDRYEKSNIGEEIVRLKRNIDRGIGNDSSQYTDTFLNKFNQIQKTLSQLSK